MTLKTPYPSITSCEFQKSNGFQFSGQSACPNDGLPGKYSTLVQSFGTIPVYTFMFDNAFNALKFN